MVRPWGNALSWDVFGYHLYLPATFLWHDPGLKDFSKVEAVNKKYENTPTYYQGQFIEREGQPKRYLVKYTMGVAVLESPFFFAAHLLAPSLGYEQDGFSLPYNYALIVANFFWVIIGFIFLRKALLKIFSDGITALLLALIVLGTNYYLLVLANPGMTHCFEFSLFAMVLYFTICWHETPKVWLAVLLGLCIGLVILVRPLDAIIVLVPVFWGIGNWSDLFEKIKMVFTRRFLHLLCLVLTCLLVISPQMYYWYKITGSWLIVSYSNNPGEGFDFLSPHITDVLFSFRKGWFIYTPLMLLAVAGLLVMWKKNRKQFWSACAFFLLNIYVVSSWSCWWYAGSYGQRAMVESYAVMVLPLGWFFTRAADWKKPLKTGISVLTVFLVLLNIFQEWQYYKGVIPPDGVTAAYYKRVFGKLSVQPADRELLMVSRSTGEAELFNDENKYVKHVLFEEGYERIQENLRTHYVDSIRHSGKQSYRIDTSWVFSPVLEMPYEKITGKDHAWIRSGFWFFPTAETDKTQLAFTICFMHGDKAYKYFAAETGDCFKNAKVREWNYCEVDYLTPEVRNTGDPVRICFWLRGQEPVYVDDLKVEAYERKE
ncbi:MAG: hypothetical protein FD123_79 [Bacteroidetes bacterium]|nr:MAG: hypothetical protein FD123_79 [Bacteroidota bacterium]